MTTEDETRMICSNPIDAAVLADYWLGALPEDASERIETHLLACDACGERLREVMALAQGIRKLAREGSLRMIVSDAFLKRAAEEGLRVREYAPPAGGSVQCTVTAEDDILIGCLAADLSGAKRVDLAICDTAGSEQLRMRDIPVNAATGRVVYQESITFAKAAPTMRMIVRLFGRDESGAERLLGEYIFNHTRSMPGPDAL
jgi:hypothetical protein